VRVRGEVVADGGPGILVLVGVTHEDTPDTASKLARRVAGLRIFEDDQGKMNLDLAQVKGGVVVVPQFTLYGDTSHGRRPSWIAAAPPQLASELVETFALELEGLGATVRRGAFREHMEVELVNYGPVTLLLEA